MIDLVAVLTEISEVLPALPELVGAFPALEAAPALAGAVGANPNLLIDAHSALTNSHSLLTNILSQVAPIFSGAVGDIVGIGRAFLQDAGRLLPQLLSPTPGQAPAAMAQLAALPGLAFGKVRERLEALGAELVPAVTSLNQVAVDPAPNIPEEIPPVEASAPAALTVGTTVGDPVPAPEPKLEAAAIDPVGESAGQAAVAAAKSQLGTPYVWGGTTPGAGFDCSGLTQWAWRQAGVELPRLAQEQSIGRPVAYEELQAGDLLVWDGHVAMYDGAGSIVEAGDPVSVNPIRTTNMGMAFEGYFRPTG